ncbi:MAG: hypothetical protein ABI024_04955 [Vicinamibacterales bacterium]
MTTTVVADSSAKHKSAGLAFAIAICLALPAIFVGVASLVERSLPLQKQAMASGAARPNLLLDQGMVPDLGGQTFVTEAAPGLRFVQPANYESLPTTSSAERIAEPGEQSDQMIRLELQPDLRVALPSTRKSSPAKRSVEMIDSSRECAPEKGINTDCIFN